MTGEARPPPLTRYDRVHLAKGKLTEPVRGKLPNLWLPYEEGLRRFARRESPAADISTALWRSFRLCAEMMLALDSTYWAFTRDRLLAWRAELARREQARSRAWWTSWHGRWSEVTTTLFFLEVLPYTEDIFRQNHRELADKCLARATARYRGPSGRHGHGDRLPLPETGASAWRGPNPDSADGKADD
jgi:hypothetical protein